MTNQSPNFYRDRIGTRYDTGEQVQGQPQIVVLHLTEGSYNSAKGWLCSTQSQASSSVIFGADGRMEILVEYQDAPWTNGFRRGQETPPTNPWVLANCWRKCSPNLYTVSAEIEWFQSWGIVQVGSVLYQNLVQWIAGVCGIYGIPPTRDRIMGHYEIDPEGKPFCGRHIPWDELIRDVQGVLDEKAAVTANQAAPSSWALEAWTWATKVGITDGTHPHDPITREEVATMLHRFATKNRSKNS